MQAPSLRELALLFTREGRPFRFRASGDSMHPTIRDGERIVVEPLGSRPARTGEIVLVDAERGLTAHRVIGPARDGRLRTRGDGAWREDFPQESERVLGRVVAIERDGTVRPLRRETAVERLIRLSMRRLRLVAGTARRWLRNRGGRRLWSAV